MPSSRDIERYLADCRCGERAAPQRGCSHQSSAVSGGTEVYPKMYFGEFCLWCCNPVQQTHTPCQHMSKVEFLEIEKREKYRMKLTKQTNKQRKQPK
jgi:hypothetical protein